MVAADLRLGQSVEVHVERGGHIYRMVTKIQAVEKNKIYVTLLTMSSQIFQIQLDDKVTFICSKGERIWSWTNVQASTAVFERQRYHVIQLRGEAESYNRRDSYRVPYGRECRFLQRRFEKNEETGQYEEVFHKQFSAIIKDISEAGIGVVTAERLEPGDVLEFLFDTGALRIDCAAKVVRSMPLEEVSKKKIYGCMLVKTSKDFTKFVVDTQRKQLQNLRSGK